MKETKLEVKVRCTSRRFYLVKFPGRKDWHVKFTPPRDAREFNGAPARVVRNVGLPATMDPRILAQAKAQAAKIIEDFWAENKPGAHAETLKLRSDYATIGEILEAFNPLPSEVNGQTAWNYRASLRTLLRDMFFKGEDKSRGKLKSREFVEALRADVLTEDLARKFLTRRERQAIDASGNDHVLVERAKVSANSILSQARSIFKHTQYLKGLRLPDLTGFLRTPKLRVKKGYTEYKPLPPDVISSMDSAVAKLKKTEPEVYKAYLMMRYLGLRNKELVNARWNWIEQHAYTGEYVFVLRQRPDCTIKNGIDRNVPITPATKALFDAARGSDLPTAYIINLPSETQRRRVMGRRLNAWMRAYIPRSERIKCSYNLRKQTGSILYHKYGIEQAALFLGDNPKTVLRHYAAAKMASFGIDPTDSLVSAAKGLTPQLAVVK